MSAGARPSQALIIFILVLASSVSIMSTDLYAPSLPHLPAYFGTTEQAVKLTISLNLLAFGLAQLVHGPLSDRYGRRPVMLAGLATFTLFSLGCAVAQTAGQLIVARIFQGITASVEAVVGLAIIRDLFDEVDRVRALAIWGMAIAITPAAAPILGGYIHVAFGWRANFELITALGLLTTILMWRLLPESTEPDTGALNPKQLARDYLGLLRNRVFLNYALMMGCGLGAIFAFITAAPFILIARFGVATQDFGLYQAAIVAAYFVGSLVSNRLASTVDLDRLLGAGMLCAGAGALALPILLGLDAFNPLTLTAAMSVLGFGLGPIFAVAPSRALDAAPARTGSASAAIGAIEMIVGGLASSSVTALHDGTSRPLVITVLCLLAIAVVAYLLGRRTQGAKARFGC